MDCSGLVVNSTSQAVKIDGALNPSSCAFYTTSNVTVQGVEIFGFNGLSGTALCGNFTALGNRIHGNTAAITGAPGRSSSAMAPPRGATTSTTT